MILDPYPFPLLCFIYATEHMVSCWIGLPWHKNTPSIVFKNNNILISDLFRSEELRILYIVN